MTSPDAVHLAEKLDIQRRTFGQALRELREALQEIRALAENPTPVELGAEMVLAADILAILDRLEP